MTNRCCANVLNCSLNPLFRHNVQKARLGAHDRKNPNSNEQVFEVSRVTLHEQYKDGRLPENDLAILELDRTAVKTDFVYPICVPKFEDFFAGQVAQVAGTMSDSCCEFRCTHKHSVVHKRYRKCDTRSLTLIFRMGATKSYN